MMQGPARDDAFARFYGSTAAPIRAYILRHCRDRDSVDDLLQITYVKFLGSRMARTPEAPEARAYLYRIASNVITDHGRGLQRRRKIEDPDREARFAASVPGLPREESLALRAALRSLSEREQKMLWLLYGAGFSHKEVANIMGVRSASVRVLAFRARRKLADRMDAGRPDSKAAQ